MSIEEKKLTLDERASERINYKGERERDKKGRKRGKERAIKREVKMKKMRRPYA